MYAVICGPMARSLVLVVVLEHYTVEAASGCQWPISHHGFEEL